MGKHFISLFLWNLGVRWYVILYVYYWLCFAYFINGLVYEIFKWFKIDFLLLIFIILFGLPQHYSKENKMIKRLIYIQIIP